MVNFHGHYITVREFVEVTSMFHTDNTGTQVLNSLVSRLCERQFHAVI